MPIFEYICRDCKKRFEALVYGTRETQCPLCHGSNLDQQISVFSMGGTKPSNAAKAAAACGGGT